MLHVHVLAHAPVTSAIKSSVAEVRFSLELALPPLSFVWQVVNLHYMLSKTVVKARPSVLWCYKKDLYLSRCVGVEWDGDAELGRRSCLPEKLG